MSPYRRCIRCGAGKYSSFPITSRLRQHRESLLRIDRGGDAPLWDLLQRLAWYWLWRERNRLCLTRAQCEYELGQHRLCSM
jgi:hypothetical protein